MDDCLFCKIIAGKIPSKKVYEDDKVFASKTSSKLRPTCSSFPSSTLLA